MLQCCFGSFPSEHSCMQEGMIKGRVWYLGMAGGVAARGPLAALVKREEEGACCLERRLSSLSTCFITFSVSFMRACSHTTSCRSTPHTFSSMMMIAAALASGQAHCLALLATGTRLQGWCMQVVVKVLHCKRRLCQIQGCYACLPSSANLVMAQPMPS